MTTHAKDAKDAKVAEPLLSFRGAQREFIRRCEEQRMVGALWRRQFGKTTTFSAIALKKMMESPGRLVTYASATLLLGRELILKEAALLRGVFLKLAKQGASRTGAAQLDIADREGHEWRMADGKWQISEDDFAELFESQRLMMRLWHDRNTFSRTQIVAPSPATAVGWTGDVLLDEVGRIPDFRGVWEAMEPIVASSPDYRLLLCTTPPPDDTHFSFDMLGPKPGIEFKANLLGNWYESEMGVLCLRVSAFDAWADGVPVYDLKSGEALAPAEHFWRSLDKDAWRRNYGVEFLVGGTGACNLLFLNTAQTRGIGECACIVVDDESDVDRGLEFLRGHIGDGKVGVGWDLATTEKESSNPSALVVVEQKGTDLIARLVLVWKSGDPELMLERVLRVLQAVRSRASGGPVKRVCVDATNERLFATQAKRFLRGEAPVELVVGSEAYERPGMQKMNMKQYLGSLLVGELEDNHLTLPPEAYVKTDLRLVRKVKGSFDAEVSPEGMHGDVFDGLKLAVWALIAKSGRCDTVIAAG